MKAYIDRILGTEPMHPMIARALTLAVGALLGALLMVAASLQAADPQPPQAADFNCDTVAQANGIEVYYCVGDSGPPFLMNGYGFIVVVPD